MATFDELWNLAFESYLCSTGRDPRDCATLGQLHNVDDLLTQLEAGQRKFGAWRAKYPNDFSNLSKAIKPLQSSLILIEGLLFPVPFPLASTIFNAARFLIEAADGVSEAYGWITQLFDKLAEFAFRLEEYIDSGMNTRLQHKVVAILSCILEILGISEGVIRDGRFRKFTAVLFLGKDEKVKASFDRLSKLVDDEERLVVAISYATNQRIDRKTDKIDRDTEQMRERLDQVAFSIQGMCAWWLLLG